MAPPFLSLEVRLAYVFDTAISTIRTDKTTHVSKRNGRGVTPKMKPRSTHTTGSQGKTVHRNTVVKSQVSSLHGTSLLSFLSVCIQSALRLLPLDQQNSLLPFAHLLFDITGPFTHNLQLTSLQELPSHKKLYTHRRFESTQRVEVIASSACQKSPT